ncbi:MAG: DUF5916 domain-containing protein [Ignavibacteriales bacterium]|nr:DUF5916 domain-containing protein [Ignavibacteriales bacterium]
MNIKFAIPFSFLLLFNDTVFSFNLGNTGDTIHTPLKKPLRVYNATRLTTEKPAIDGVLDDACWKTGEWAGDFTQWVPREGAKPSQPTQIKILYDDKNIYVAIRAFDSEPDKIIRKAGRRDELNGDIVGINFDSYHDHRTGFEFDVTSAGQKIDLMLTNPSNADYNWNAVWYVKTGMEDSAWTAEYEIPLSQLRYSSDSEQVWGMHCWRWIDRLQEESDWEVQSSTGPGMLYQFGELHGIKELPQSRRIEIMPYALGKLKTFKSEPGNPFADKGRSLFRNLGLDAKIGLSSNFTADLTINPDFGQVESDPSVMNLTAFETFYEEKRPFFLEGKNIFSFDVDDASIFYSRRIGHSPNYTPTLGSNEFLDFPDNTTILSAAKVSGKTSDGLAVGILQSLTANEQAKINSSGEDRNVGVEPLTNYLIARVQKDFSEGNTMLGGILTSTNRFIKDSHLEFMNHNAYTGGIDLLHYWNDKEFFIDAKLVGSTINGSTESIRILQNSSARYYQRPDVDHFNFDSTRTELSGYGGRIRIGKGSIGLWRYSTGIHWRSPGLDLNDMGYMQTTDIVEQENAISYFVNQPVSIFRTYSIGLEQFNNWDYGMNHLYSGGKLSIYLEFLNNWAISTSANFTGQALDTHILRGGSAMLVPAIWSHSFYVRTDPSEKIFFDFTTNASLSNNKSSQYILIQPGISVMPINTLKITMSVNYSDNLNNLQYIDTKSVNGDKKYILGKIKQQTIGATFRIDYNITTELSIQYYGSPFATVGKYSDFKSVTNPKAAEYNDRYSILNPVFNGNNYEISENNIAQVNYSFGNPDFNFSQLRSNLVLRWEYRPGSQIYFVWSQDRTNYIMPGNTSVYNAVGDLGNVYPNNIFLIKINYWFSI